MRKYLIGLVVFIALAFSGCSKDVQGDLYNLEHYGNVKPQKIQSQGLTWGILDKPEEGRMIVVPLDDVLHEAPFQQYEVAAQDYFERGERACKIIDGKMASTTDFSVEYFYSCKS